MGVNIHIDFTGFPDGSDGKESACNAGGLGSISGSVRSPGEEHSNPIQYSSLGNPIDRRARQATVHGVEEGQAQLNDQHFDFHMTLLSQIFLTVKIKLACLKWKGIKTHQVKQVYLL